jgi:Raf kinase inhibitor-like YbhB/YbcL family protein
MFATGFKKYEKRGKPMRKNVLQRLGLFTLCFVSHFLFSGESFGDISSDDQKKENFQLESSAFKQNGDIPIQYTGEGKDISPPLVWENVPIGTQALALTCDDPDAPGGNWVHWILYNIPSSLNGLKEGGKDFPPEILVGKNSWGNKAYGGPHPPQGTHHYYFTVYALDSVLSLKEGATKEALLKAMEGHILGEATLIGLYRSYSKP